MFDPSRAAVEAGIAAYTEAVDNRLAEQRVSDFFRAAFSAASQADPALGFTKEEIEALLSNEGVFSSSDKSELQSPHSVLLSARLKLRRSLEARK